tara:strand:- start:1790 stop:1981 length:192 start_codon:yes stop_codon:yes gene_type:complete
MTWKDDKETVIDRQTITINDEFDLVVINLTIKRSDLDAITNGFVTKAKMKEFILALVPTLTEE